MNTKFTLKGNYGELLSIDEIVINKSRFIAYVYNVDSIEQINKILDNIKSMNKDAKHIVYAYRLENTR